MEQDALKVGMKPSHPGEFIREEIVAELNLTIGRAAEILGVRRATLSDLLNEKSESNGVKGAPNDDLGPGIGSPDRA